MRLHSNTLTEQDVRDAVAGVGRLNDKHQPVGIGGLMQHGSRSHSRAFELRVSGSSINGGAYGTADYRTATWDEWGTVLAALYQLDDEMIVGPVGRPIYDGRNDFDRITVYRFENGAPEDPCLRHKWDRHGRYSQSCKRCSAEIEYA